MLSDFDLDLAVDALFRVDNANPADIPDDLLVKAARRYLETIDDPDGGDPGQPFGRCFFNV